MDPLFFDSIERGNIEEVTRLIPQMEINILNDGLLICVQLDNVQIANLLLEHGADIHNMEDQALIDSAENGHIDMVRLLLGHEADIEAQDGSALIISAANGHTETVRLLLENGADVHAGDDEAIISSVVHPEITALLLDYGADVHAMELGFLQVYARNGLVDRARSILERIQVPHWWLDRILIIGVENRHIDIVRLSLDHGANVRTREDRALRRSAENGDTDIVRLLLEHGADVHAHNDYALTSSIENGHAQIARLLLDYGADDPDFNWLLPISAQRGHTDAVRLLLEKGANIRANNDFALLASARNGHDVTAQMLLSYYTPLQIEEVWNSLDYVKYFNLAKIIAFNYPHLLNENNPNLPDNIREQLKYTATLEGIAAHELIRPDREKPLTYLYRERISDLVERMVHPFEEYPFLTTFLKKDCKKSNITFEQLLDYVISLKKTVPDNITTKDELCDWIETIF